MPHLISISSQVIGWVRKRLSLPRRARRSWQAPPERGFSWAGASGAADFSSSCGEDKRASISSEQETGNKAASGGRRSSRSRRNRRRAASVTPSPAAVGKVANYSDSALTHDAAQVSALIINLKLKLMQNLSAPPPRKPYVDKHARRRRPERE